MAHTRERQGLEPENESQNIKDIFFDYRHPAGFASVKKLRDSVERDERGRVLPWLRAQAEYTTYVLRRKRFPTNLYLAVRPDQTWEIDLMIFDSIREHNEPFRYVMLVCDVFDKYILGAAPMKTKTGAEASSCFQTILDKAGGRKCETLRGDAGKEWLNKTFMAMLKRNNIRFQVAGGQVKGSIVERTIRTIKNKLYKVFYFKGSYRYLDILDVIVDTYNRTRHSATRYAPSHIASKDYFNIWFKKYLNRVQGPGAKPKFQVGDYVRLSADRSGSILTDRGYFKQFTEEIFRIVRVQTKHRTGYLPRPIYHLEDLAGEAIKTGAYGEELIPVRYDPQTTRFRIEKIVSTRRNRRTGVREHLVKFLGYPNSMNQYIPVDEVGPVGGAAV
jgi:hypothetical protein